MYAPLVISSWVAIYEGCDFTCEVSGGDGVSVTVTGKEQVLDLFFDAEALRQFLKQSGKALEELDALTAQEEVRCEPEAQNCALTVAARSCG